MNNVLKKLKAQTRYQALYQAIAGLPSPSGPPNGYNPDNDDEPFISDGSY